MSNSYESRRPNNDDGENLAQSKMEAVLGSMPEFTSPKVETIKTLTEYGFDEKEAVSLTQNRALREYRDETLSAKINEISDYLESSGYSKEDVIKMGKRLPAIYDLSIDNMRQKIIDMEELGYSREDVIRMTKQSTVIYSHSIDSIKQKIADLKELGYSREDVVKITKQLPSIYGLSIDNIKQKMIDMEELGYSREDVIRMTKQSSAVYGYSMNTIKQKIMDMEELGYSRDDVIKMTKQLPTLYDLSIDNLRQKITDLEKLGYAREEVLRMTKQLPAICSLSINNMKQKIEFYDSLGMHDLAITDTRQLMQGVALSYGRYEFLAREKGIRVNMDNYKLLFMSQKDFENRFGKNNAEIKQKYPYDGGE